MKRRYKIRGSALLAAIALLLSVGTISVQAAGTCQRIVRRIIQRAAPVHHSKATVAAWKEWGKAHPNWHPPRRPASVSPKEVAEKVNFACEVPTEAAPEIAMFTPEAIPSALFPVELISQNTLPPVIPPTISLVNIPATPPPGGIPDVPEPISFVYMATAGALLMAARRWQLRHAPQPLAI